MAQAFPNCVLLYLKQLQVMKDKKKVHADAMKEERKKLQDLEPGVQQWLQQQPEGAHEIPCMTLEEQLQYGKPGKLRCHEVITRAQITEKRTAKALTSFFVQTFQNQEQPEESLRRLAESASHFVWQSRPIVARRWAVSRSETTGKRSRASQQFHRAQTLASQRPLRDLLQRIPDRQTPS